MTCVLYIKQLFAYKYPMVHLDFKISFFVLPRFPCSKSQALCRWVLSQADPTNSMFKFHECLGSKKTTYTRHMSNFKPHSWFRMFFGCTYAACQASGGLCGLSSSYGSFDASARTCFPCSCLPWIQGVLLGIPLKHEQLGTMGFGSNGLQIPLATETTPAGTPSPLFAKEPTVPCKLFVGRFHLQIKSFGWKVPCAFHVEAGVAKICHICWLAVAQYVTTNVCCVQKKSSGSMILTDLDLYRVFYLRYTRCPKTWPRTLIQVTKPELKENATFSRNHRSNRFFLVIIQQLLAQDQCPSVFFDDNTTVFPVFGTEPW